MHTKFISKSSTRTTQKAQPSIPYRIPYSQRRPPHETISLSTHNPPGIFIKTQPRPNSPGTSLNCYTPFFMKVGIQVLKILEFFFSDGNSCLGDEITFQSWGWKKFRPFSSITRKWLGTERRKLYGFLWGIAWHKQNFCKITEGCCSEKKYSHFDLERTFSHHSGAICEFAELLLVSCYSL